MNNTFNAGETEEATQDNTTDDFVDVQEEMGESALSDRNLTNTLPSTPLANSSFIKSGSATISRGTRPPVDISPILPCADDSNSPRYVNRQRQKTMVVESGIVADMRKYLAGLQDRDEGLERNLLSALSKLDAENNRNVVQMSRLSFKLSTCKEIMGLYAKNQMAVQDMPIGGICLSNTDCQGQCESSKKLKLDLDAIKKDHDDLYREYTALFEMYGKVKQSAHSQRGDLEQFEQRVLAEREEHNKLKAKFLRLKENASEQLQRASQDMDDVERKHVSDTQGLRMKVRTLELQLRNTQNEVELKRREVDELREMVAMVLNEVEPGSDVESDRGI